MIERIAMSEIKVVLDALKDMKEEHGKRLSDIETAINTIAVQQVEIGHMQANITELWGKYNELVRPGGVIAVVTNHQASCPRKEVDTLKNRVWGLLVSFVLLIIGVLATYLKK
jgi:hypothetical protein